MRFFKSFFLCFFLILLVSCVSPQTKRTDIKANESSEESKKQKEARQKKLFGEIIPEFV